MLLSNKKVHLLLLIALSLRLALFLGMKPWNRKSYESRIIVYDARAYNDVALNLLKNHRIERNGELWGNVPGYPIFIAAIYSLFGYRPYMVVLIQIFIGAVTCFLLYKLGTMLFDEKVGLVAGYLLAFEYVSIMFEQALFSDTLFTFLFILAIYFFVKFFETDYKKHLVYVGIFLGLATHCRPISLYFPVVLVFLFIFKYVRRKIKFTKLLVSAAIVVLSFWITILPGFIRNYLDFGTTLQFSVYKARILLVNAAYLENAKTGISFNAAFAKLSKEFDHQVKNKNLSSSQLRKHKEQFAIKRILKNPLAYTKMLLIATVALYSVHGKNILSYLLGLKDQGWLQGERHQLHSFSAFFKQEVWPSLQGIINTPTLWLKIFFLLLLTLIIMFYLAVITGATFMWRNKKISELSLLICTIVYFTTLSVPSANLRYRIPIMPFLIVLAAFAIVKLWNRVYSNPEVNYPALKGEAS